jgi:hypothetical protein
MNKFSKKTRGKALAPERLMYVGPTILGGLTQNTVYEGIPAIVDEIKEDCPLIVNLFVSISKYPKAAKQIRTEKGNFFAAYKSVDAYKAKHRS